MELVVIGLIGLIGLVYLAIGGLVARFILIYADDIAEYAIAGLIVVFWPPIVIVCVVGWGLMALWDYIFGLFE